MIVIDASVAAKLINTQEEGGGQALALLKSHLSGQEKIFAPSLLFLEVANALATKTVLKESYIKKGIQLLYAAHFTIHEVTEKELIDAALLAKQYGTSVYDMVYAVIAKKRKATLFTADRKFIEKTKFAFVHPLFKLDILLPGL